MSYWSGTDSRSITGEPAWVPFFYMGALNGKEGQREEEGEGVGLID